MNPLTFLWNKLDAWNNANNMRLLAEVREAYPPINKLLSLPTQELPTYDPTSMEILSLSLSWLFFLLCMFIATTTVEITAYYLVGLYFFACGHPRNTTT